MNKYIFTLIISFLFLGCQSMDPLFKEGAKKNKSEEKSSGAYYLDDGPEENLPNNLDEILDAQPKYEALSKWASRPYVAFDKKYTPMKKIIPFEEEGYASWYGKRYHGKKTSIGEVYDMYQMTGAHKTLPLPCYIIPVIIRQSRSCSCELRLYRLQPQQVRVFLVVFSRLWLLFCICLYSRVPRSTTNITCCKQNVSKRAVDSRENILFLRNGCGTTFINLQPDQRRLSSPCLNKIE